MILKEASYKSKTNSIKLLFFFLLGSVLITESVQAQISTMSRARRNVATTVLAGLGGAALGLGSIGFYSQPEDHLENITIGFSAGLILGTIYVMSESQKNNYLYQPVTAFNLKPMKSWAPIYSIEF